MRAVVQQPPWQARSSVLQSLTRLAAPQLARHEPADSVHYDVQLLVLGVPGGRLAHSIA